MADTNYDALSNSTYNPQIDSKTLNVYKSMNTPDSSLLDEYKTMIMSYSTKNPYNGALYNPRHCEITQVSSTIDDIQKSLKNRYNDILRKGTPTLANLTTGTTAYTPTQKDIINLTEWNKYHPQINSDLTNSQTVLSDLGDHTNRIISNLPSFLGMIQQYLGIATALAGLANPCIPFKDFIGSILDKGAQLINKLVNVLNSIQSVINSVITTIKSVVSEAMAIIASIQQMILNEIANLANALLAAARFGLSQLLNLLPNDPCIKSLLTNFTTPQVLNAIM